MEPIKLATEEQVKRIADRSDLGPTSYIWAMGEDLAVSKTVTEIDPVFFAEDSNTSRRLVFIWGLENMLRSHGVPAYYYNVHADDEVWQHNLKTNGAKVISTAPELRFKKEL